MLDKDNITWRSLLAAIVCLVCTEMLDYFAITFAPSPEILSNKLKLPGCDLLFFLTISYIRVFYLK